MHPSTLYGKLACGFYVVTEIPSHLRMIVVKYSLFSIVDLDSFLQISTIFPQVFDKMIVIGRHLLSTCNVMCLP
jgi:hypothetical protein